MKYMHKAIHSFKKTKVRKLHTFSICIINNYSCNDNSSIKQNQNDYCNLIPMIMNQIPDSLPYMSDISPVEIKFISSKNLLIYLI